MTVCSLFEQRPPETLGKAALWNAKYQPNPFADWIFDAQTAALQVFADNLKLALTCGVAPADSGLRATVRSARVACTGTSTQTIAANYRKRVRPHLGGGVSGKPSGRTKKPL
jgi:hypothetical protein